ncbi:MAG TPA: tetratricopeptide repeat protein [Chloroflexi bacterium]|nr:tetratricopeptide repeat protein [Chloroflexota bacterium]
MIENSEKKPEWVESPIFEQGIIHSEAEEWEQAIPLFSQLAAEYPHDQELQKILADLRLKASLSRGEAARGRLGRLRPGRRALRVFGALALLVLLLGVSYIVYVRWIVPTRALQAEISHLRGLHAQARAHLAAGEYDEAADLYREILSMAPDDAVATDGLTRVDELRQLATAYDRALTLTQEEKWDEALEAWQAILAADPNFRDVKHWMEFVEAQGVSGSLFVEGRQRYESGDWQGAIDSLEELRAQDPDYRREEVESLLVSSLVNQAEQVLSSGANPAEAYEQVMELFDEAIEIRPQDESLLAQRAVAEAYSRGFGLFDEGRWEGAIAELQFVWERQADYAGGQALQLLYEAYVNWGDERAQAGDLQGALACYQTASELPAADTSQASTRYTALLPSLTPSPTPRRPAATPTPTKPPAPPTATSTRSPYSYYYVAGSAQQLSRPGCPAPSIEGRVLDAAGIGVQGVWVRLQWWNNSSDRLTGSLGEFGFAPLDVEHFDDAISFTVTLIRSPSNPTPLSPTATFNFPGCYAADHDGFTNILFKAVQ